MVDFSESLLRLGQLNELVNAKKAPGIYELSGVIDNAKAHLCHVLGKESGKSRIFVTYSEAQAKQLWEDICAYDSDAKYYPAKDMLFYGADIRSNALAIARMEVLKSILLQNEKRVTIVTTIDALMNKVIPKAMMDKHVFSIETSGEADLGEISEKLSSFGYIRDAQVERPGEFAVRGGIIDIFPVTMSEPVRIELWDTEVDTIRTFDPETQRSLERIESVRIYPAREAMIEPGELKKGLEQIKADAQKRIEALRRDMKTEEAWRLKEELEKISKGVGDINEIPDYESYLPYFYSELYSVLDYFEPDSVEVYIDEYARVKAEGEGLENEFAESMSYRLEKGYILDRQTDMLFGFADILKKLAGYPVVLLSTLAGRTQGIKLKGSYSVSIKSVSAYNGSMELLVKELRAYKKQNMAVTLLSPSAARAKRIAGDLVDEELPAYYSEDNISEPKAGTILVTYGNLRAGFVYPDAAVAVISESDIFGRKVKRHTRRKYEGGEHISSFSDLHVGDYIVHENHGIGIYKGIEQIETDNVCKDYIKIEYARGGTLYILATQLEMIQKYSGGESAAPKLHTLGGGEWRKTRERVKHATEEIADELVQLYALRSNLKGYQYGSDTTWQKEFEEAFPFEETDCQLAAIEATKRDMESPKIMDRLICGDVGFGKTEIAIRAAFKAVQDNKQVAILAPTTILAQQHFHTFCERMKDYPVKVGLLCRLRTESEIRQTLKDLASGQVDIIIGTHRLLSADVVYKNLGLLIIDEEQRFGVTHKEKIKTLKKNVDVLSLTATPIPRTLHMSLIGIRDMSLLEEAPAERLPVQTYVMEYDEEMVREGIRRELARGGQVYYIHNRIRDIADEAARLEKLIPDAAIAYAHGQMDQRKLEDIMYRFVNGEIDVLISTTIVEIGLDIPNCNTIMIQDAENFGLSQLYQLRGRVGRSSRNAYAFLMYRRNKLLKEEAEKRLAAIREFTELGSGFKIAMRDLEIRGAGNLLGEAQSGHMDAVGYDLYCKMLSAAVSVARGETTEEPFETTMDIMMDAYIPSAYIPDEFQKIDIYKRIALLDNEEEIAELEEELVDRFGDYPACVDNLFMVTRLKALAHDIYFTEVKARADKVSITFHPEAKIRNEGLMQLLSEYRGYLDFYPKNNPPKLEYTPFLNSNDTKSTLVEKVTEFLQNAHSLLVDSGEQKSNND